MLYTDLSKEELNNLVLEINNNTIKNEEFVLFKEMILDKLNSYLEKNLLSNEDKYDILLLKIKYLFYKNEIIYNNCMIQSYNIFDFVHKTIYEKN
jgi:hypothetical protein